MQGFPAMEGVIGDQVNNAPRTLRVTERTRLDVRTTTKVRQAWVYLRNVGQGPAILGKVIIWNAAGEIGELAGPGSIGSRDCELFTGELAPNMSLNEVAAVGDEYGLGNRWRRHQPERIYWLQVIYSDVFGTKPLRELRAWFDPTGRGHWEVVSELSAPPYEKAQGSDTPLGVGLDLLSASDTIPNLRQAPPQTDAMPFDRS